MSNARFSILQARAVGDKQISNAQFRTLAALGLYGDKEGWCYPKLKTIGTILGKSKQAVSMDIKYLVELGYLEVTPQYRPDGSQQNNLYRLIFDPPVNASLTPRQDHVDPPLSSGLNPPLSSEVDALTPHINAPLEPLLLLQKTPAQIYESEIGVITPFIREELLDIEKNYPAGWFEKAVRTGKKSTSRLSINYVRAILARWKAEGLPSDQQDEPQKSEPTKQMIQLPDGQIVEATA